jgi:hypothetical protein
MATALQSRPATAPKQYQAAQQAEYLYLEAEIHILLRQLQNLKTQK